MNRFLTLAATALATLLILVSCGEPTDPVENTDPVLSAGTVSHFHCELTWTQLNRQGYEFDSYNLYRSESPGIASDTSEAECIASFDEISRLQYTDSLLEAGGDYYYALLTRMHESGKDQDVTTWSNEANASTLEAISVEVINNYGYPIYVMAHHYNTTEQWISFTGTSSQWVETFNQQTCVESIPIGGHLSFVYPQPISGDGPRIFFNEHTFNVSGGPPDLSSYNYIYDKIETNWNGLWNTTCVDFFAIPTQIEYSNQTVGFNGTETRTSIMSALINSNPPYGSLMGHNGNRYFSPQFKRDSSTVSTCLDTAIDLGLPQLASSSSTWDYGSGFTFNNITYHSPNELSATVTGGGVSTNLAVTATVTTPGALGCTIPWTTTPSPASHDDSTAANEFTALIGAALNRGVLDNYNNWDARSQPPYYTSNNYNNDEWNYYSMVLHSLSKDNLCYGMPYDDYYQQNTGVTPVPSQGLVTITILQK